MRVIKYLINFISRKRFIKKQTKIISKYIKAGIYKFNNNCYYIVLDENKEKKKAIDLLDEKLNERRKGFVEFVKKILSQGRVKIKNEEKRYNSTLILLTHQNKSLKMFDFENNVVITKYFKHEEYLKTKRNYEHFKKSFKTPQIINTNDNESVIIEEFINYTPTSTLNNKQKDYLINDIFERYIKYLKNNKDIIAVNNNYASIKSLGDLMYKNIFYKEDEFYYIDFELSSENFILYDIFTFIFYAYYNNDEAHFYKNYINGSYDKFISEIFNISGISYDNNKKSPYFDIFLNERIKEENKFSETDVESSLRNKYENLKKL